MLQVIWLPASHSSRLPAGQLPAIWRGFREVHEGGHHLRASKGESFGSFSLRLGGFAFRGRWRRSLSCEPFFLQTLTVVRECLLRDLVLSHCLLGVAWRNALWASRSTLVICLGGLLISSPSAPARSAVLTYREPI